MGISRSDRKLAPRQGSEHPSPARTLDQRDLRDRHRDLALFDEEALRLRAGLVPCADRDPLVAAIDDHERYRDGDADRAGVHQEVFVEALDAERGGGREVGFFGEDSLPGFESHRQRLVAVGGGLAINVEAGRDREFHRERQALTPGVLGGVEPGANRHLARRRWVCAGRSAGSKPEHLAKERGPAIALAIAFVEALLGDNAVTVEREDAGVGDACDRRRGLFVIEPELADDGAAFVRKQFVADGVLFGESGQAIGRVVADGVERDAGRVERVENLLQPNELRLAKRSPAGAAVEHDKRGAAGAVGVQVDHCAVLVGEHDVREALPGFGAEGGLVGVDGHGVGPGGEVREGVCRAGGTLHGSPGGREGGCPGVSATPAASPHPLAPSPDFAGEGETP